MFADSRLKLNRHLANRYDGEIVDEEKKTKTKLGEVTEGDREGEGPPPPPAGAVGTGGWVENGTVKDSEIR